MKIILLLCAALALTITAVPVEDVPAAQEIHQVPVEEVPAAQEIHQEPVEDVPAAQEIHQDGELPVKTEVEEVKSQGEEKRSGCPSDWSPYGSRCFDVIHTPTSWVEAERYCQRYSANLASIHSYGEYQFIQEIVRNHFNNYVQAWIGGSDAVKSGAWLWSDGSRFFGSMWSPGEPRNWGSTERCIVANHAGYSDWGAENCDYSLPFVCGTRS